MSMSVLRAIIRRLQARELGGALRRVELKSSCSHVGASALFQGSEAASLPQPVVFSGGTSWETAPPIDLIRCLCYYEPILRTRRYGGIFYGGERCEWRRVSLGRRRSN